MSYIQKNWKTFSAGLLMIVSALVPVFWPALATKIVGAAGAVLGGIGLIVAGDASASIQTGDTVTTSANTTPHTVTKVDPTTGK